MGDVDYAKKRDIIMQTQSGQLQRISEFRISYLGYQYALLFHYGEDSYRPNLKRQDQVSETQNMEESEVTEMESDVQSFERVTKRKRLNKGVVSI